MAYNFTTQWQRGKDNSAADAPSRHPHWTLNTGDDLAEHEIDTHEAQPIVVQALSISVAKHYVKPIPARKSAPQKVH